MSKIRWSELVLSHYVVSIDKTSYKNRILSDFVECCMHLFLNVYLFGHWLFLLFSRFHLLGGLRVTNPPIRLMCPTSVCPSTFFVSGL